MQLVLQPHCGCINRSMWVGSSREAIKNVNKKEIKGSECFLNVKTTRVFSLNSILSTSEFVILTIDPLGHARAIFSCQIYKFFTECSFFTNKPLLYLVEARCTVQYV